MVCSRIWAKKESGQPNSQTLKTKLIYENPNAISDLPTGCLFKLNFKN